MAFQTVTAIWDNEAQGFYCPDCYHPMEMKEISFTEAEPQEVWQCDYCENEYRQTIATSEVEMHYLPLGDNIPDEPEQLIVGNPCPHCNSTLTDDVLTIWEDDDRRCLHNVCYWCGEGFETVKPKAEPPAPGDTDGIPF